LLLSSPKISTGVSQKLLLQQRQVFLLVFLVFHFKHRSTPLVTAVSYFRASNPREHSDFRSKISLFQTANQKIRIISKIVCLQSPSILVPRPCRLRDEKRAMGTRMVLHACKGDACTLKTRGRFVTERILVPRGRAPFGIAASGIEIELNEEKKKPKPKPRPHCLGNKVLIDKTKYQFS